MSNHRTTARCAKRKCLNLMQREASVTAARLRRAREAVLADWFVRQFAWWSAFEHSLRRDDPRRVHALRMIARLHECRHVLVCPNHGIEGVEPEDWPGLMKGVEATPEWFEALAYRGLLEKDGWTGFADWEAYCLDCIRHRFKEVSA